MNKRLKEIEDQCWYQEPCDFDMKEGGLSTIQTKFDQIKFAEMIVQECAAICLNTAENFTPVFSREGDGAHVCYEKIIEQFGVEQ